MHKSPWHDRIATALQASGDDPTARFVQLATITPKDRPANRTLVFRGFLPESEALMFVTDARSQKVRQLQQNPQAALCWYFTKTRQQFRLTGEVTLVASGHADSQLIEARRSAWSALSDSVRRQFTWPEPRAPRSAPSHYDHIVPTTPPDTFVLLLFQPCNVDFLDISVSPHKRILYHLCPSGDWLAAKVNP
jgi:PPOX class probable FMN-dependent enzyme